MTFSPASIRLPQPLRHLVPPQKIRNRHANIPKQLSTTFLALESPNVSSWILYGLRKSGFNKNASSPMNTKGNVSPFSETAHVNPTLYHWFQLLICDRCCH